MSVICYITFKATYVPESKLACHGLMFFRSAPSTQPTMHCPVVSIGINSLVAQDLDMFAAGSAVELVGSGQPTAHPVREPALFGHMVLEIRRGLHSVLSNKIKEIMNHENSNTFVKFSLNLNVTA